MTDATATYSRKSTKDDRGSADQSVTRQSELAARFAAERGWPATTPQLTFVDNEVSATDWKNRHGWKRLRATAEAGLFSRLIVMDQSRISRDQRRGPSEIAAIEDCGVEIWSYSTGQRISFDEDADDGTVITSSANSMVDAIHKRNARRLAREALRRKAEQGYVAGGIVYGYTNVEVRSGKRRDHVVREISPEQAKVVRRIFELSASGFGLLKIAKTLNREQVPSPTGRGWASTGIREMLRRELYRGVIVYGLTKRRRNADGGRTSVKATEKPIRVVAPALRIVSEELWLAVHKRLERTRETYPGRGVRGQLHGRREAGLVSQYMLSGFLRCSCGGNLIVTSRSGRGGIKKYWICTVAHHRGKEICANVKAIPYDALTTKIIATFRESILSPNVLAAMAEDEMRRRAESPEKIKAEAEELRNEFRTLERQTARLVDAIQNGSGDLAPITEALRANERRKADVQAKLEHLDGLQQAAETFDADAWLAEQKQLLADIEQALQLSPPAARRILRICLPKPLVVSADGRGGWTFRGEGCFWERDLKKLTFELKNREIRGHLGAQPESGPLKLVAPG